MPVNERTLLGISSLSFRLRELEQEASSFQQKGCSHQSNLFFTTQACSCAHCLSFSSTGASIFRLSQLKLNSQPRETARGGHSHANDSSFWESRHLRSGVSKATQARTLPPYSHTQAHMRARRSPFARSPPRPSSSASVRVQCTPQQLPLRACVCACERACGISGAERPPLRFLRRRLQPAPVEKERRKRKGTCLLEGPPPSSSHGEAHR